MTLTLSGVVLLVSPPFLLIGGVTLILIGSALVFLRRGVILDFENKKIKEYIGLFLIKLGKWNNLNEYPYVSVLVENLKSTGFSTTGVEFTERKKVYRIYFMNESHRKRLRIMDFKLFESATSEAKRIAHKMQLEYTEYNPN